MSRGLLRCSRALWTLSIIDRSTAREVRALGCPHCGGRLHTARYPRKPRGVARQLLGDDYFARESFCCRDCRRRTTPPSLRFLGRKVYLGALLVLFGNVAGSGPSAVNASLRSLAVATGIPRRTLERWRTGWTDTLPITRWWREVRAAFVPAIAPAALALALLARVVGLDADARLRTVLTLTSSLSTITCSHFPRIVIGTQKMP